MVQSRSRPKRTTQRNIAQEIGISVAAVSRALADDPLISEETRVRVRQKADEMGYVPDRAAQRLRTGRTNVVSLVLPPHEEILGFGTSMLRGLSSGLMGTPFHLVVAPDFDSRRSLDTISRIVENGLADGLILSRTEPNDLRIRYLIENDFPFVSHGRTELATQHPYVDYDNYDFAHRSVMELHRRGADHAMILLPPENLMFHHHLHNGFVDAAKATGMAHCVLPNVTLDQSPQDVEAQIVRSLSEANAPNGLVLPGDASALAALAALDDLGLEPNKDVHLMVKQTSGVFDLVRPKVTCFQEDVAEAGKMMATFLTRRIAGSEADELQLVQPCLAN